MLLEAKEIHKSYGQGDKENKILNGISLQLPSGFSVAIVGASGNGKSTLLHILGSLERPTQGVVKYFGKEVFGKEIYRLRNQEIGFVFQNFFLLENESVLTNILMPSKIHSRWETGLSNYQLERRAKELAGKVSLSHKLHEKARLLSGGEKQRVAIARSLMNNPRILLADEPSGNLDKRSSGFIHELLFSFLEEDGKGLILVTHDLDLSDRCSCQFILEDGQLFARNH